MWNKKWDGIKKEETTTAFLRGRIQTAPSITKNDECRKLLARHMTYFEVVN